MTVQLIGWAVVFTGVAALSVGALAATLRAEVFAD
ncbi:hypothetical protein LAUMK136_01799 [Mycobacterium attenuatum]|uniref:Uncharacterized protein n=1 Tax=Mycobacterium attenuatum TaxID=2341086 RepID=A0A498PWW3_9MYCO|nr:hypothetical protein LAUMK136_01799 [Mycobacterium attenuatum]